MIQLSDILAVFPKLSSKTRDDAAIAAVLSVGRVKVVSPTPVGIGTILRTLGPTRGASFLDSLQSLAASNSVVKWGLRLIENSNLDVGDPLVAAEINSFAQAGLLTQAEAAALVNIAVVPDPVSSADVADALEGWAG